MPRKFAPPKQMELNLTSMMDVTFQLILFFLLVNNMSSAELPKMETPKPVESQAQPVEQERKRVVINVIPDGTSGLVESIRVGIETIGMGDIRTLTTLLKNEKDVDPEIEVDLRADVSIHYSAVQPIMQAITGAGIARINLVAQTEEDAGRNKSAKR